MDFIDKEDIVAFEVGEDGGEVAGAFDGGSGGGFNINADLGGDDMGEAGLAQAGRAVEQDVVDGLAAALGGGDGNLEVLLGLVLADEVGEGTRPEGGIEGRVLYIGLSGDNACDGFTPWDVVLPLTLALSLKGRGKKEFYSTFTLPQGRLYFHLEDLVRKKNPL